MDNARILVTKMLLHNMDISLVLVYILRFMLIDGHFLYTGTRFSLNYEREALQKLFKISYLIWK